jgi:phosphoribosylformylglycinamidine (FGAM) synthase-like amidotransferase family enzyme
MVYTEYETTISALFADIPYPANPNGSIANIAGVCNPQGNVFGLMPAMYMPCNIHRGAAPTTKAMVCCSSRTHFTTPNLS